MHSSYISPLSQTQSGSKPKPTKIKLGLGYLIMQLDTPPPQHPLKKNHCTNPASWFPVHLQTDSLRYTNWYHKIDILLTSMLIAKSLYVHMGKVQYVVRNRVRWGTDRTHNRQTKMKEYIYEFSLRITWIQKYLKMHLMLRGRKFERKKIY